MGKIEQGQHGHAKIEDFFAWISERHRIYNYKASGCPKPWSDDPIFQRYKFTNVFRELDTGTLALRKMLKWDGTGTLSLGLTFFNVFWYRMFNRVEHASFPGICLDYEMLAGALYLTASKGDRIFTSAHMTVGKAGELKIDTILNVCKRAFGERTAIAEDLNQCLTLEEAFKSLRQKKLYGCGRFIAYEIISDLRWTNILRHATDKLSWANIGPGCKRGLQRLGMDVDIGSLRFLYDAVLEYLEPHVLSHCAEIKNPNWPPFEMREIEHSLCEFDKYQRVATGAGKPRQRYNGTK